MGDVVGLKTIFYCTTIEKLRVKVEEVSRLDIGGRLLAVGAIFGVVTGGTLGGIFVLECASNDTNTPEA